MKQIDKIIESSEAPKDKNVLWVNGDKLLSYVNGKWTPVGGGSASTKNQDKSVDIVENGVTEVTADSGYTGLGKVTINANVQGGGSSSGSDIRYIRASGSDDSWLDLIFYATLVAAEFENGDKGVIPPILTRIESFNIKEGKGLAFCWDAELKMQGQTLTLGESMAQLFDELGIEPEYLTKEEFYNLVA